MKGKKQKKKGGKSKAGTESFFVGLLSGNVLLLSNKIVRLFRVKISHDSISPYNSL